MGSIFQPQNPREAAHLGEDQMPLWDEINSVASVALIVVALVLIFSMIALYSVGATDPPVEHESAGFVYTGISHDE